MLGNLETDLTAQNISFQFIALLDLKKVDSTIIQSTLEGYGKTITVQNVDAYIVTKEDIKKITDIFAVNQTVVLPNYVMDNSEKSDSATGILAIIR
ncbi:MAG: hypothetical protein PHF63_11380 [Herbinix sp.]|nr:hypothetical protein [Herbinix sp.]